MRNGNGGFGDGDFDDVVVVCFCCCFLFLLLFRINCPICIATLVTNSTLNQCWPWHLPWIPIAKSVARDLELFSPLGLSVIRQAGRRWWYDKHAPGQVHEYRSRLQYVVFCLAEGEVSQDLAGGEGAAVEVDEHRCPGAGGEDEEATAKGGAVVEGDACAGCFWVAVRIGGSRMLDDQLFNPSPTLNFHPPILVLPANLSQSKFHTRFCICPAAAPIHIAAVAQCASVACDAVN